MAVLLSLALLLLAQFVQSYPYPHYKRASYRPAYVPLPVPYAMGMSNGMGQNFEEGRQEAQNLSPYYYYYPMRNDRRVGYLDENSDEQSAYPYGQEMWYEGGNDAMTAAANAAATREAILQNLIIAQMFEDAAASAAVSGYPYYQAPPEDFEKNKEYKYGVKTTGVEENERARQLLKNEEDQEVKQLENLRKAKESNKEAKRRRKQKNKEDRQAKQMQETLAMEKRQDSSFQTTVQPLLTDELLAEQAAISGRKELSGQKEVMMPQPARPARHPFSELSQRLHTRSDGQSAYQTIKQLLEMENDYRKVCTLSFVLLVSWMKENRLGKWELEKIAGRQNVAGWVGRVGEGERVGGLVHS